MTKARLEFLCYAAEAIGDAQRGFESVFETCIDEIWMFDETELDAEKMERLKTAEDALKAGLGYLEIFKKSGGVDDGC